MTKYCLEKWDKNEKILRERLKNDENLQNCQYLYIVQLVVECILNGGDKSDYKDWSDDDITEIQGDPLHGVNLYIIHKNECFLSEYDYIISFVDYGSCSGCDTLLSIQSEMEYGDGDEEETVNAFVHLCKDIVTNIVSPFNIGWRKNADFDTVEV